MFVRPVTSASILILLSGPIFAQPTPANQAQDWVEVQATVTSVEASKLPPPTWSTQGAPVDEYEPRVHFRFQSKEGKAQVSFDNAVRFGQHSYQDRALAESVGRSFYHPGQQVTIFCDANSARSLLYRPSLTPVSGTTWLEPLAWLVLLVLLFSRCRRKMQGCLGVPLLWAGLLLLRCSLFRAGFSGPTLDGSRWQSAQGKVLLSRVENLHRASAPEVLYAYWNDGVCVSNGMFLHGVRQTSSEAVSDLLKPYPVGAEVTVYHDGHGQSALIRNEPVQKTWSDFVIELFFLFPGGALTLCGLAFYFGKPEANRRTAT
ncbi:MAG: DUF3592 domain-containing protein [Vulcanimicrobiota bacterium]